MLLWARIIMKHYEFQRQEGLIVTRRREEIWRVRINFRPEINSATSLLLFQFLVWNEEEEWKVVRNKDEASKKRGFGGEKVLKWSKESMEGGRKVSSCHQLQNRINLPAESQQVKEKKRQTSFYEHNTYSLFAHEKSYLPPRLERFESHYLCFQPWLVPIQMWRQ